MPMGGLIIPRGASTNTHSVAANHLALLSLLISLTHRLSYEPRHEKTRFLHYAKTKTQISCAKTAQLISVFVFAT